jgi:hypothetical protein
MKRIQPMNKETEWVQLNGASYGRINGVWADHEMKAVGFFLSRKLNKMAKNGSLAPQPDKNVIVMDEKTYISKIELKYKWYGWFGDPPIDAALTLGTSSGWQEVLATQYFGAGWQHSIGENFKVPFGDIVKSSKMGYSVVVKPDKVIIFKDWMGIHRADSIENARDWLQAAIAPKAR